MSNKYAIGDTISADEQNRIWQGNTAVPDLTAGETMTGATTPVPVYQDVSDNKFYNCDANDTDKLAFVGFCVNDVDDTDSIDVIFEGILDGFTGLDEGEKYYVQDDGTIGTDEGTYKVLVGRAVSSTRLFIINTDEVLPEHKLQYVLAENLSAEDVVQIIDDGGVAKLKGLSVYSLGTEVEFESGTTDYVGVESNGDSTICVAYRDAGDSNKGKVAIGTISGTVITFGTPVEFEAGGVGYYNMGVGYDSDEDKFVITYRDEGDSNKGKACVISYSGTTPTAGTPVQFDSGSLIYTHCAYDPNAQKVLVIYNISTTVYGIVGTVSGTSISFGSSQSIGSGGVPTSVRYDPISQKLVCCYNNNSSYPTVAIGTISGTSVTFGTPVVVNSQTSNVRPTAEVDNASGKVIALFADSSDSNHAYYAIGTISGTSISFGSATKYISASTARLMSAYNQSARVVVSFFRDLGNSDKGTQIRGTFNGSSISWETEEVVLDFAIDDLWWDACYDAGQGVIVAGYVDENDSDKGKAFAETADEAGGLYGIMQEDGSSGETKKVVVKGGVSDEPHSGLTINSIYYLQSNGTLGTTETNYPVGRAIDVDKIVLFPDSAS